MGEKREERRLIQVSILDLSGLLERENFQEFEWKMYECIYNIYINLYI